MSGIMTGVYEPVLSYQFKVFLVPTATDKKNEKLIKDASDALGFSEISMGSNETEVYEYQEGGENSFIHSFPSITKAGKLTLSHGLSSDSTAGALRKMITGAEDSKYEAGMFSMAIGMFSYPNSNPSFWYFTDVWISKMEIGGFKTGSSDVIIESLELVVKKAELEIAKGGGAKKKTTTKTTPEKTKKKEKKITDDNLPPKKEKTTPEKTKKKEEKITDDNLPPKEKKKKKKDDGWKERNRIRREKQAKKIEDAQKKKGNKNYKKNTYDGTLDNPAEKRKKKK